jgi:phage shock protein PspC (stress-responsive transcriptional regulator)
MRRSATNKVVAGVAGGIAETYGWDPTLVRLGFVLLTLLHGGGVLLYLALLFIMPKADATTLPRQAVAGFEHNAHSLFTHDRNRTLGYALLGLGVFMLAGMLHIAGPVMALLIAGAGWYLLRRQ